MTNNLFWSQFLEIYQSHPALWQSEKVDNCADSKEKGLRMLIEKMREVNPDANREMVLKKINIFRSSYKREVRKVKNSLRSGRSKEELYKPKLWYFDQLKFLDDTDSMRSSSSKEDINKPKLKYFDQFKFLGDTDGNVIGKTSTDNDMTFVKTPRKRGHDGNLRDDKLLAGASKLLMKESEENSQQEDEDDYMFKWLYLKFKKIPFGEQRELVQKIYLDVAICCSQGLIDICKVKQIQEILYSNVSVATKSDNPSDILSKEEEEEF
ncbi:uncharacterized protein LOC135962211 [Calliphora vicina]|uniref:uncharacterized protein LOC135962211 n=1 Tax=Calliphora vicina TaxID=7373 RepID=UPI00325BE578